MKSQIFYTELYQSIQQNILLFLNRQTDYMGKATIKSTRATGDAIQGILEENFESLLGDCCKNYSSGFARRSMADLAFVDVNDFYYVVDVKTHRMGTGFNMPNLTSVERLARFYEDDSNYFIMLMVDYETDEGTHIDVKKVYFTPIEFLSWNCLTIGALGWGQIQIANANNIELLPGYSRKKWMLDFCDFIDEYYPREISKIHKRMEYFAKMRKTWQSKTDIWS